MKLQKVQMKNQTKYKTTIKYKKQDKNLEIEIYAKQGKENVILYIKDNGIGIKKGEIVFL